MNKTVIKKAILNTVGFSIIIAIVVAISNIAPYDTALQIGVTYGSLIGITILYNAIKRYIIGKKEEIRIEHELIEKCLNEIDGLKFTIKEMNNK